MRVSVIIVSYNTSLLLKQCIESVYGSNNVGPMEIIVVDNASSDDSVDMVQSHFPKATILAQDSNLGFARANNLAFARSCGEYVALLNPDATLFPEALENSLRFMDENSDVAACGGLILDSQGNIAPSARRFPTCSAKSAALWGLNDGRAWDYVIEADAPPLAVDWIPGTFTVFRRCVLEEQGFFDERYFMYFEETDLCLRLKRSGYGIWCLPGAKVSHIGGASARNVKREFDESGSQVALWRIRSEYLYLRKNMGLASMLCSAGSEMTRHLIRYLLNSVRHLAGSNTAEYKKKHSARVLALCIAALVDTRMGSSSPPTPW